MKAILKFDVITILRWSLLISLYFLFPKYFTELLCYHHQRLKSFLYRFCHTLDEGVIWKYVLRFRDVASLEHLLPYLVWRHKKAYADSFNSNILRFDIDISKLSFNVLFHPGIKLFDIWLAESELRVFFVILKICDGMVMEPNL